jgi:hypothetical protein
MPESATSWSLSPPSSFSHLLGYKTIMNMSGHELEPQSRPPPTDGGSTVADDEGLLQREFAHTQVNITPTDDIAVLLDQINTLHLVPSIVQFHPGDAS